jgi:protein O-mannosyl-transferase
MLFSFSPLNIFYLKYLKDLNKKYYLFALLLFLVSLLSKAMAASLPLVLILTDYFKGRKINTAILIEKAPFLLLSIIIGVVAVFAQISSGASQLAPIFTFSWRIIFASYGFMSYLIKLLFPLNLRAFYPYPMGNIGIYIPAAFYIYLLSFLGLAIYIISSLRFTKKIIFGLGFFTLTICLVLQFLPVGKAIMADRYAYIPSIGIFYLAGEGLVWLWNKNQKLPVIILLIVSTVFFSVKTYAMCGIWKNDITLWTDVIRQDNTIEDAYFNRAISFAKENRNDEAIKDFTRALELKTDYAQAYNYRSMVYITKKRNDEAITDLNKAIGINPGYAEAYNNRGYIFMNEGRNDDAIKDFNKAIELKPDYAKTYNNRGNLFVAAKRNEEAIKDFNKAIELDANYSEAYNSRGISFVNDKRFNEAENDFNKAIKIKADNAEAYFNRGTLYFIERKNNEAIRDFTKAIELNQNYAEAYTNLGNIFFAEKRYEEAINQYSKAITLKTEYAQAYYNRGLAEFYFGKKESACSDLNKAADLGYKPATAALIHFCK